MHVHQYRLWHLFGEKAPLSFFVAASQDTNKDSGKGRTKYPNESEVSPVYVPQVLDTQNVHGRRIPVFFHFFHLCTKSPTYLPTITPMPIDLKKDHRTQGKIKV